MWWWDRLIEDKMRSAQEKGLFDNLAGQGEPLPQDDETRGEDWLGNHMLRQAGLLPDWLQLRKEIEAERPTVRAALDEYWRQAERDNLSAARQAALLQGFEKNYIRLAREINNKIDQHNLRCPSIFHEIARFPEDAIARRRQRSSRH
jgi:hypothetical protein